jgi:hypothetical protein
LPTHSNAPVGLSPAQVNYYDPYVPVIPETWEHRTLTGRNSLEWDLEQFGGYDAALMASCALDPINVVGKRRSAGVSGSFRSLKAMFKA